MGLRFLSPSAPIPLGGRGGSLRIRWVTEMRPPNWARPVSGGLRGATAGRGGCTLKPKSL